MNNIWTPITLAKIPLKHRLAMAPLTRSRANADGTPSALAADYYAQRASFGLLISEGTQPSADGQGYPNTPGIYTAAQVAGWQKITQAVHAAGGRLFIQLMHAGRMSHPDNTPHHRQAVAPSAIATGESIYTLQGLKDIPAPRALTPKEIAATVEDFAQAAAMAIEAGADGVEIHAANGYLIHQFLANNTNQRNDHYGASLINRARFALDVARAVVQRIGAHRTGIRLSPGSRLGGIDEGTDSDALYSYLVSELAKLDLAYLHLSLDTHATLLPELRQRWPNTLLVNRVGRPLETLASDIETGLADMATVGRWALANPDFIERLKTNAALNAPDPATFYGAGAAGYTDYPTLPS